MAAMRPASRPRHELDRSAFPSLGAYVDRLPQGLESHRECRTKASVLRALLECLPGPLAAGRLPAVVADALEAPPLRSAWMPTVVLNAVQIAVADALGEAAFLRIALDMNRRIFASPMYRPLVCVASPATLLKVSSKVWGAFHTGTTLRTVLSPGRMVGMVSYPPHLFVRVLLEEKAGAFHAALEAAGAKGPGGGAPTVKLTSLAETRATFVSDWVP